MELSWIPNQAIICVRIKILFTSTKHIDIFPCACNYHEHSMPRWGLALRGGSPGWRHYLFLKMTTLSLPKYLDTKPPRLDLSLFRWVFFLWFCKDVGFYETSRPHFFLWIFFPQFYKEFGLLVTHAPHLFGWVLN